jgi:hypothetical protein
MFTLVGPNGQTLEVVGLDGLEEMLGLPHDGSLSWGERALAVLSAAQQRGYDLGGIGQGIRRSLGMDEEQGSPTRALIELEEVFGLPRGGSWGERACAVLNVAQQKGYDLGWVEGFLRRYVEIGERNGDFAKKKVVSGTDDGPSSAAFRVKRHYS